MVTAFEDGSDFANQIIPYIPNKERIVLMTFAPDSSESSDSSRRCLRLTLNPQPYNDLYVPPEEDGVFRVTFTDAKMQNLKMKEFTLDIQLPNQQVIVFDGAFHHDFLLSIPRNHKCKERLVVLCFI